MSGSGLAGRIIVLALGLMASSLVPRTAIGRTWTMADGHRTLDANFVSLDKGEVSLQTTANEIRKIPIEDLSDLDRDIATRLGAAAAREITVNVEGVGLTPTKALEDAFLRAVMEAVGVRVKSKTVTDGDVLVEDKVLVFSDGFISSYDRVSSRQEAGLSYERIKAVVRRRDISEKPSSEEESRGAAHLYAEAFTKIQRHRIATAVLQDAVDGFGAGILAVKLRGRNVTEVIPDDLEHVRVRCDIKVTVDVERYRILYEEMISALSAVARSSGRFSTPIRSLPAADPAVAPLVSQLERQFLRPSENCLIDYGTLYSLGETSSKVKIPSDEEAAKREGGSTLYYLCVPPPSREGSAVTAKTCAWRWFEVDGYLRLPAQQIAVVVRYSGASGDTVFEDRVAFSGRTPGLSTSGRGQKLRTVVVSPFFLYHGSRGYSVPDIPHAREVTIRKTLRMPLAILSQVRNEQALVTSEVLERQAESSDSDVALAAPVLAGRGAAVERFIVGRGTIEVHVTASNTAVNFLIQGKGYRGNPQAVADWIVTAEFTSFAERVVRSVARTGGSWHGEFKPIQIAADGTVSIEMIMRRK